MKRVINHIRRWNKWRKGSLNSRFYKFLVLIGVRKSPTMPHIWLDSEWKEFGKGFHKGIIDGIKVINNGKCMLCGRELTEGIFFCKECEAKSESEDEK